MILSHGIIKLYLDCKTASVAAGFFKYPEEQGIACYSPITIKLILYALPGHATHGNPY